MIAISTSKPGSQANVTALGDLSAQGKIDYLAALNVDKKEVQSNSSSSWMGMDIRWFSLFATAKSESKDSSIQTRAATTSLQSEADILSESGGSTRLQGTQVKAQNFTVNAGVGPKADPNAKIIIEGVKETLHDMGKSDSIKSIITSAVTAGALQSINPDWMKQLSNTGQFTDKAVINLTNAAASATIKTAIQGGSYEDNLTASLKTAGIDTGAGWAASNIGQGYKYGSGELSDLQGQYIAHKVAHALMGCASAAAKDTSCAAGAIGGAVGEAFAEFYTGSNDGSSFGIPPNL